MNCYIKIYFYIYKSSSKNFKLLYSFFFKDVIIIDQNKVYIVCDTLHIFEQLEYSKPRGYVLHQKLKKKEEKKCIAEARHARQKLTWKIFVRYFTKIPKTLVEVGASVCMRGCRRDSPFFSFLFFSPRAILNGTTHEKSFLNQPAEVRELRKRVRRPFVRRVCSSTTTRPRGAIRAATRLEFRHGNRLECACGIVGVKCIRTRERHTKVRRTHSLFPSLSLFLRSVSDVYWSCAAICNGVRERCSRKNPIHRRRNEKSERVSLSRARTRERETYAGDKEVEEKEVGTGGKRGERRSHLD